jgi:hypothetical protein
MSLLRWKTLVESNITWKRAVLLNTQCHKQMQITYLASRTHRMRNKISNGVIACEGRYYHYCYYYPYHHYRHLHRHLHRHRHCYYHCCCYYQYYYYYHYSQRVRATKLRGFTAHATTIFPVTAFGSVFVCHIKCRIEASKELCNELQVICRMRKG